MGLITLVFLGTFGGIFAAGYWLLDFGLLPSLVVAAAVATLDAGVLNWIRARSTPASAASAARVTMLASLIIATVSVVAARGYESTTAITLLASGVLATLLCLASWMQLRRVNAMQR